MERLYIIIADMAKRVKEDGLLSKHRLEALTDSIYAFAMTLLILNFDIPKNVEALRVISWDDVLLQQPDKIFNYIISFIFLAVFWLINQQQFRHIEKTDNKHIWFNIITLMFVVFIPFSTSMVNELPNLAVPELVFATNFFIVGLMLEIGWIYATGGRRLVAKGSRDEHLNKSRMSGMVIPFVALIAMISAFYEPRYTSYIYLLIPVLLFLPPFR
jgi:uncharacterized membrane protein